MAISNGYTDLSTLKGYLNIGDTDNDTELETAIEAASRKIDDHCGRRFWVDAEDVTRYFTPDTARTVRLGPHIETADVASITSVTVDTSGNGSYDQTWTEGTHFRAGPLGNPDGVYWRLDTIVSTGRCWPAVQDSVKIVGTFGIETVPTDVKQACIIQAAKVFQVSTDGGGGFSDFGTEGGSIQSMFLERSVKMLLDRWVHPLRRLQFA